MAIPEIEIPFKVKGGESLQFLNRLEKAMLRGSTQAQKLVNRLSLKGVDTKLVTDYSNKVEKLNKEFRGSDKSVAEYEIALSKLKDELRQNARETDKMEKAIESARVSADKFINKLSNRDIGKEAIDKYKQSVNDLTKRFKNGELSVKEYRGELQKLKQNTKDANKNNSIFNTSFNKIGATITKAIAGFYALQQAVRFIASGVRTAIEYEEAWLNVEKRLNQTGKESEDLRKELLKLSTEITLSFVELSKIAETAGQLGIAAENIAKFTESIAGFSKITGKSAEEAAESFGVLIKATGGTADEIEGLVANATALGSNFATNEQQIATFAKRIAGAGTVANIASKDLLAIGAAFSQIGIPAQRGGTAVSRVLLKLSEDIKEGGEDLEIFSELVGKKSEDITEQFEKQGGAAELVGDTIKALADGGIEAKQAFEQLFGANIRTTQAFLTAANGVEEYDKTLERVSDTEKNTIEQKARLLKLYDSEPGKIQRLNNKFDNYKADLSNFAKGVLVDVGDGLTGVSTKWNEIDAAANAHINTINTTPRGYNQLVAYMKASVGIASSLGEQIQLATEALGDNIQELNNNTKGTKKYNKALEDFRKNLDTYSIYTQNVADATDKTEDLEKISTNLQVQQERLTSSTELSKDEFRNLENALGFVNNKLKLQELQAKNTKNALGFLRGLLPSIGDQFRSVGNAIGFSNDQINGFVKNIQSFGQGFLEKLGLGGDDDESPLTFSTDELENNILKQKRLYKQAQDNVSSLEESMQKLESKEVLTKDEINQWEDYNKKLKEAKETVEKYESSQDSANSATEGGVQATKTLVEQIKESEKAIEEETEANEKKYKIIESIMEAQGVGMKTATKYYNSMQQEAELTKDKMQERRDAEEDKNEEIKDGVKESVEAIKDYEDAIEEVKEEINEFAKEATDSIVDINNELDNLTKERGDVRADTTSQLGERRVELSEKEKEIQEELNQLTVDSQSDLEKQVKLNDELRNVKNELRIIDRNLTDEEIKRAKIEGQKTEAEKILDREQQRLQELDKQQEKLEEQRAIADAIRQDQGSIEYTIEDDELKAYYTRITEQGRRVTKEITDFENKKYAQSLSREKEKLEERLQAQKQAYREEFNTLEQLLIDKAKLEAKYAKLFVNSIDERTEAVKRLATQIKALREYQDGLDMSITGVGNNSMSSGGDSGANSYNSSINIDMGGVVVKNQADENRLVRKIKESIYKDYKYANLGINN